MIFDIQQTFLFAYKWGFEKGGRNHLGKLRANTKNTKRAMNNLWENASRLPKN